MSATVDHVGINVTDFEKAKAFYVAAFRPLGLRVIQDYGTLIGMGLSGLCVVLAVGDLLMGDRKRLFALIGLAVAGLATLALMIGAAITTAAATNGADTITDIGENVGVYASAGTKFMALSWVSFAVMFLAFAFWAVSMCSHRRAKKRAMYGEKPRGKWSF